MGIGPTEIIIILVVGVLLFGARLPQLGKNLGLGIRGLRDGLRGVVEDDGTSTPKKVTAGSTDKHDDDAR